MFKVANCDNRVTSAICSRFKNWRCDSGGYSASVADFKHISHPVSLSLLVVGRFLLASLKRTSSMLAKISFWFR